MVKRKVKLVNISDVENLMQSVQSLTAIWIFPVEILCECKIHYGDFQS